MDMIGVINY